MLRLSCRDQFEAGGSRGVPREEQREGGGGKEGVTHDLDAFVELREQDGLTVKLGELKVDQSLHDHAGVCVSLSVQHGNEDEYEE